MAEDTSDDPLTQAFTIMEEVMDHFRESTNFGQSSTGMDQLNPDALFQEAENLLGKGQSAQEVTKILKDKSVKKIRIKSFSTPDQAMLDAPEVDKHKCNETKTIGNLSKNKIQINDEASCSTSTRTSNDGEANKHAKQVLLSDSDEEMEDPTDKPCSSMLHQTKCSIKEKSSLAVVQPPVNSVFPNSSNDPKHDDSVTEVTIDSDMESSGSVECLNTRPSSSASDVFVVESQDTSLPIGKKINLKMDEVLLVSDSDGSSVNSDSKVSVTTESSNLVPVAGTSHNKLKLPFNSPDDKQLDQEVVESEALEMSHLLPCFELKVIEEAFKDHCMLPNRKYIILSSFIASARAEGHKVSDAAYAKLESLRKGKRSREGSDLENKPKKKKLTTDFRGASGSSLNTNYESKAGSSSATESKGTLSLCAGESTSKTTVSSSSLKPVTLSSSAVHSPTNSIASTTPRTSKPFNEGASTSSHNSSVLVASSPVPLDQLHQETTSSAGNSSAPGVFVATAPVPLEDVDSPSKVTGFSITIDSRSVGPPPPPPPGPWEQPQQFQWRTPASDSSTNNWPADSPESPLPNENNWGLDQPPTPPSSDEEEDNWPVQQARGWHRPQRDPPPPDFEGLPITGLSSEARKAWLQEKIVLISSIVGNVPAALIAERVKYCTNDEDIERVTDVLLNETITNEEGNPNQKEQTPQQNLIDEPQAGPSGLQARVVTRPNSEESASSSTDRRLVDTSPGPSTSNADDVSSSAAGGAQDTAGGQGNDEENEREEWIESHSKTLWDMFPDADPEHLSGRCMQLNYDQAAFEELVLELMENKAYPKMEEYIKRKKRREMRKKFIDGMSVPEFLELFEEPEKVFFDSTKEMSAQYRHNSRAQLLLDLPYFLSRDVDQVLQENNFHYLPSLRKLQDGKVYGRRKTKRKDVGHSGELEDFFLKELCYARLRDPIAKYRRDQTRARKKAFEFAKKQNLLCECPICCEDEILEEDMRHCESDVPHGFCKNCVKRYSEEQIGQGSLVFRCLEGECKAEFALGVLKSVLKSSVFSSLLKRKQAQEIMAAGITDLESCPFCDFATIMPNKDNKVFNCLNPECLKDSCRLCKQQSHIPLRCEEVESNSQLSARTYLENQMSEAMVRECYNCGKRFIKEDGCNKMVCSCRAVMCYLCKKPIKGYDHFSDNARGGSSSGKCPLWSNSLKLHAEEVQQRAEEAKKTLDPAVQLKHDPTKDLPQVPDFLQGQPTHHAPRPMHRPPPQPPRHFIGPARVPVAREGEMVFADLINQLEDAEYVVRRLNQQEWRHPHIWGAPRPLAHLPEAAPGAVHAAGGNWLQVQVNLDNRNMEHPRVEVQAGGAGNNQWQIQYNVLNQNRGAQQQQPPPPNFPPRAVPGIVQPLHQQPPIGQQYQPPHAPAVPYLGPHPPPPAHRHDQLLRPLEALIPPPPPAHRLPFNQQPPPPPAPPHRAANPLDMNFVGDEIWLRDVAEFQPRNRLAVFGDARAPQPANGPAAGPADVVVLPEQRDNEVRQAEGKVRPPQRPRRH